MGTKREGDACYDKAAPDEPIFVLRAQDELAEALVREWARKAAGRGTPIDKCNEAMALADAMRAWLKKKVPD